MDGAFDPRKPSLLSKLKRRSGSSSNTKGSRFGKGIIRKIGKINTTRMSAKESGRVRATQSIIQPEAPFPGKTVKLSPESMTNRAETRTQVLKEILDGDEGRYHVRHWGINE